MTSPLTSNALPQYHKASPMFPITRYPGEFLIESSLIIRLKAKMLDEQIMANESKVQIIHLAMSAKQLNNSEGVKGEITFLIY